MPFGGGVGDEGWQDADERWRGITFPGDRGYHERLVPTDATLTRCDPLKFARWLIRRIRPLVPALVVLAAACVWASGNDLASLDYWLDSTGPLGPLGFIVSGVVMMSLFLPKTAVSVTAGVLFGTWVGGLLLIVTAVLAALLNFAIGRRFLRESLNRRLVRRPNRWLVAARDAAEDAGFGFHLLARMTPLPTTIVSYSMGAFGARWRPFLAAAFVGALPQWLWVHSGSATTRAVSSGAGWAQWTGAVISLAAAVGITVALPRFAIRALNPDPAAASPSGHGSSGHGSSGHGSSGHGSSGHGRGGGDAVVGSPPG